MKQLTQEEFEQSIQDVIDGKTTRVELQKRYHMDRVTLNNKIQELSIYNEKLYMEFVRKFPYKPREYSHINYEAMIIDIMKKGYNKKQITDQYGIHNRTVARKIHEVEQINPELIALYRRVAEYRKKQQPLPIELKREVNSLPDGEIFICGVNDKREEELKQKEKQYNETRMAGISDTKAYGTRRTVKDLSTLYRIEIEKGVQAKIDGAQKADKNEEIEGR